MQDEIGDLRNNILWLEKQMPRALKNWLNTKPSCDFLGGILKNICETPGVINKTVFDPVVKWLADYELLKERRLDLKSKNLTLDDFLKIGLRVISKFIIVAEFFANHTDFLAPYPDSRTKGTDPQYNEKLFAANKAQKEYGEFINLLSSKLIGCNEKMGFMFLKLSKTISNLPPELQQMQNYLENQCINLRVKNLKK
jgi:hypothetical protein